MAYLVFTPETATPGPQDRLKVVAADPTDMTNSSLAIPSIQLLIEAESLTHTAWALEPLAREDGREETRFREHTSLGRLTTGGVYEPLRTVLGHDHPVRTRILTQAAAFEA